MMLFFPQIVRTCPQNAGNLYHSKIIITLHFSIIITGANKVLPDNLAIEQVLTHPSLIRYLSNFIICSPAKQVAM